ncbi:hypothetical protein M3C74_02305 [Micrococcus lylae]|uniref:hypothetical protein n=1 Tax=Micrococcus lylae TaxID=1273 RepID=UPI0021A6A7A0|nr:hypothetical protein [Micrococcus lylae]MCT2006856.1 hypothetical protein [Micrococcus lylae]MCT2070676.1 hypothetical protein [Micrococcus lylae]
MPKHRVVGGVIVTTPAAVFDNYTPAKHLIDDHEWVTIRPTAIRACTAADYATPASALQCISTVTHYLAWAHRQGLSLDLEAVFHPDHVERFVAILSRDRAPETVGTRRGYLRRVGRACTKKAPWPAPARPYAANITLQPPYNSDEVKALWDAARAQYNERRTRVAQTLLCLGLGAGLKPGEMLQVTAAHHVGHHPQGERLVVILLEDRVVPVLTEYAPLLVDLCHRYPDGPLIGRHNPASKDPLGVLRAHVEWPSSLEFKPARLRTTWMVSVLTNGVRVSEFQRISGTASAKALEAAAAFVPERLEGEEYLFTAAGLGSGAR